MRPAARWLLLAGLLAAVTLACGGKKITVDGIVVYEKHWTKTLDELTPRAQFELDCDPSQLYFTLLKRQGRLPTEVGVAGCGRKALYLRPIAQGAGGVAIGSWVLQSATTSGAEAGAPHP